MWRALFLLIPCIMWGCGHSPAPPAASMSTPAVKPPELVTHRINPKQIQVYRPGKLYALSGRGPIKDGRREGSWGFEQLDQVVAFGAYKEGMRQGYWSFGPLHAPIAAGYYVDDQPHGLWRFQCIKAGAPLCEAQFERGH